MTGSRALSAGRAAYRRQAWREAYTELAAADQERPLGPDDLQRLATAAYLTGHDQQSAELWARAHHEFVAGGDPARAVRCAFWLVYGLLEQGEGARASGWMARAQRLLEGDGRESVEHGYLLLPEALRCIAEGDYATAAAAFGRAAQIGRRFEDPDLMALAGHGQGRAMIRLGRAAEGVRLLDEAMVAVTAGEVSAVVAGDVYCSVISGCQEIFDWRRAQEWTAALARWCAAQPDLVPYRGQCLLRRSEVMLLRGDWSDALEEARRACERLSEPSGQAGVGAAFYQLGELHRLRGELSEADEAFRQAGLRGRVPQPGQALLCLVRGRVDEALAAIHRALDEAREPRTRARLLAAAVDIAVWSGDLARARAAAAELAAIAHRLDAPYLHAVSDRAAGAVLLAGGDTGAALAALRQAERIWREIGAPYETARTLALVARVCLELGDRYGAELELEAACAGFRQLGATPDLEQVERLHRARTSPGLDGLTAREIQVLRLIAAGGTNRAIAAQLRISEKTVARHVSNIFVKLSLSSRSAATAWAFRHGLVPPAPPA
jgi:DNA-binding CsgD family transcriptional regulator